MSEPTYRLVALQAEDSYFSVDESGLNRSRLIDRLAELKAVDKYNRYSEILWYEEPKEYDYSIEVEAEAKVSIKKKELAEAKAAKDKLLREQYAAQLLAADKAKYEELKKRFGEPSKTV